MDRPPARRPRALLSAAAAALLLVAGAAVAATPMRWEVAVALRITGGTGAPIALRLALPPDSPLQRLGEVTVAARGLRAEVVRDGPEPHVMLRGKLKGARRVAVRYTVERRRRLTAMPPVEPLPFPPPDLLPALTPSPLFQSRSILVREFLETHVSPLLAADAHSDLLRAIYATTRERLAWAGDGKTLPLDVIRSGRGKRLGIERAFTTFLRCADIPARFVEGINLTSSTPHKRVFWTEVWAQDGWWPVSASSGWIGREPKTYLALTRDGRRVLRVEEGPVEASYSVQAIALPPAPEVPS